MICPKDCKDDFKENPCSARFPDTNWYCTRMKGHDGFHHAHNRNGKCVMKWQTKEKVY